MAKIFSILTLIIAGLAAYLGFESQKMVDTLQATGQKTFAELGKTKDTLAATQKTLKDTETKLATTEGELTDTRAKLATSEAALTKATADLATADAAKTVAEKQLADIKEQLTKAGIQIENISTLVSSITDMTNKIKEYEGTVTKLTGDVANLKTQVTAKEDQIKEYEDKAQKDHTTIKRYVDHYMQRGTRGRVLAVNAGWGFCVTSLGDKQGGAEGKTLIVVRAGQAIGKVKIATIEANQSVADILPGTFARNAFVQPGDDVIFTGDDKVAPDAAAPANGSVLSPPLPTHSN